MEYRDELLESLTNYYLIQGSPPSSTNFPRASSIRKEFGSWNKALELANVPITRVYGQRNSLCTICQINPSENHGKCKECYKNYLYDKQSNHRLENKRKMWDYLLLHPCVDCGETDPIVLEFDHIEQSTKHGVIGGWVSGSTRSWAKILGEIKKCEIRCANCHKRRTHKQLGYGVYLRPYSTTESATAF